MTELRTEEEQIEAIKSWWKENGKSLVIMIAVAVSAVYGYKAWQNNQLTSSENASFMYQQLVDTVLENPQASPSAKKENLATSKHLAKSLKAEHGKTQYARYGSLLMAKVAVNSGDLDIGLQELDWLLEQEPQPLLKSIALIRKAQILAEQTDYSQALSLLKGVSDQSIQVQAIELEGDIYLAQGNPEKARLAYQKAMDNKPLGNAKDVLSLKLNDLTRKSDRSPTSVAEEG